VRSILAPPAEAALAEAAAPSARLSLLMPRLERRQIALGSIMLGLGCIPFGFGRQGVFLGAYIAVWAMLELSIVVVSGYAGLISLMPFSYVGIGVFATGVATSLWGWPFWLALPFAALATVPVSIAVGAASIRLKGLYLAIATLTFSNAMGETLFKWDAFTGGQAGHTVERPAFGPIDFSGGKGFYVISMLTALALVWMVHGLKRSKAGRAMLAVRDNEREAQALGINATKAKLTALVVGGAIAGVGGAFYAFLGATALIVQQQVFAGAEKLFAYIGVYAAVVLVSFLLLRPGGIVQVVKIQSERIRENPVRNIPITAALFGSQIFFIWIIVKFASGD
jgi:ABC-type branched-subunit amino acid transport system permease subunit